MCRHHLEPRELVFQNGVESCRDTIMSHSEYADDTGDDDDDDDDGVDDCDHDDDDTHIDDNNDRCAADAVNPSK